MKENKILKVIIFFNIDLMIIRIIDNVYIRKKKKLLLFLSIILIKNEYKHIFFL